MKNGVRILVVMIFGIGSVFAMRPPKRPLPEQEELAAQKPKSELKEVKFESSDGQEFTLTYDPDDRIKAPANILRTVAQLISEAGTNQIIPLPSLNTDLLEQIIILANKISEGLMKAKNEMDEGERVKLENELEKSVKAYLQDPKFSLATPNKINLVELILAANYLDFEYLLKLLIPLIAEEIYKGKIDDSLVAALQRLPADVSNQIKQILILKMTIAMMQRNAKSFQFKYRPTEELISPDGRFLVIFPRYGNKLFFWHSDDFANSKTIENILASHFAHIAPDSHHISLNGQDNNLYIYDLLKTEEAPIIIPGAGVDMQCWNSSGNILAGRTPSGQDVVLVDLRDKATKTIKISSGVISKLIFSGNVLLIFFDKSYKVHRIFLSNQKSIQFDLQDSVMLTKDPALETGTGGPANPLRFSEYDQYVLRDRQSGKDEMLFVYTLDAIVSASSNEVINPTMQAVVEKGAKVDYSLLMHPLIMLEKREHLDFAGKDTYIYYSFLSDNTRKLILWNLKSNQFNAFNIQNYDLISIDPLHTFMLGYGFDTKGLSIMNMNGEIQQQILNDETIFTKVTFSPNNDFLVVKTTSDKLIILPLFSQFSQSLSFLQLVSVIKAVRDAKNLKNLPNFNQIFYAIDVNIRKKLVNFFKWGLK